MATTYQKFVEDVKQKTGKDKITHINTGIRANLLFRKYDENDEYTKKMAKLMLHQDQNSDKPLVYDELENSPTKTQQNYEKILKYFSPLFEYKDCSPEIQGTFNYALSLFIGEGETDEEKIRNEITREDTRDRFIKFLQYWKKEVGKAKVSDSLRKVLVKAQSVLREPRPINPKFYSNGLDAYKFVKITKD